MFVHDLKQVNWSKLFRIQKCEEQFNLFDTVITSLTEKHFPLKETKLHTKDKPWITQAYKELIDRR